MKDKGNISTTDFLIITDKDSGEVIVEKIEKTTMINKEQGLKQ